MTVGGFNRFRTLVAWATILLGFALIDFGVFALWWGRNGYTEIAIVGMNFKSGRVGGVLLLIGVILLIFNYRRLLTSAERLTKST